APPNGRRRRVGALTLARSNGGPTRTREPRSVKPAHDLSNAELAYRARVGYHGWTSSQLLEYPVKSCGCGNGTAILLYGLVGERCMQRPGISDLVGRAMIDKKFLADLVRDPLTVLADYDLSADERAAIMQAVGRTGTASERDRARALQIVLMKRWAT